MKLTYSVLRWSTSTKRFNSLAIHFRYSTTANLKQQSTFCWRLMAQSSAVTMTIFVVCLCATTRCFCLSSSTTNTRLVPFTTDASVCRIYRNFKKNPVERFLCLCDCTRICKNFEGGMIESSWFTLGLNSYVFRGGGASLPFYRIPPT